MRCYRGLTKDGKWVHGWYFHLHNHKMTDGSPERDIHGIFDDSGLSNPVDCEGTIHRASYLEVLPETVGQYTGLKDKNGKEIYEGDIVNVNILGPREVKYNPKQAAFKYYSLGPYNIASDMLKSDVEAIDEIIGNIHQHPNLLDSPTDGK